jgi:hypothetical protein
MSYKKDTAEIHEGGNAVNERNWLAELQKWFSYELKQDGNSFPTECTIWHEFGVSVSAEAGNAEEAIEAAIVKAKAGKWE